MDNYQADLQLSQHHRERIESNPNILYWYKSLFQRQMQLIGLNSQSRVLELGSGSSMLKTFYPQVMTSDILELPHIDLVLDAHRLPDHKELVERPVDAIVMTNTVHHLKDPMLFLESAKSILKKNGSICFTEPYFSVLSSLIYYVFYPLHREPIQLFEKSLKIDDYKGPLTSAHMAAPYRMIFDKNNLKKVQQFYKVESTEHFTGLSYFMTGGANNYFSFPEKLYKTIFAWDKKMAQAVPKLHSSFFTTVLRNPS